MRHGCTVAVAAVLITGLGQSPAAVAACNPRNPTACTADSQPKAAAPLQLKRFIELGPARRAGARAHPRRVTRKPAEAAAAPAQGGPYVAPPASTEANTTPLTPKAIATVSVSAPALAVAPVAEDRTVGFAAATEAWSGENAFAAADDSAALPPGITIARFDEVNAIDLAADAEAKAAEPAAKSDRLAGVSVIAPANAAPPPPEPAAAKPKTSWLSWLYGSLIDGMLAAVLAIRAMFV